MLSNVPYCSHWPALTPGSESTGGVSSSHPSRKGGQTKAFPCPRSALTHLLSSVQAPLTPISRSFPLFRRSHSVEPRSVTHEHKPRLSPSRLSPLSAAPFPHRSTLIRIFRHPGPYHSRFPLSATLHNVRVPSMASAGLCTCRLRMLHNFPFDQTFTARARHALRPICPRKTKTPSQTSGRFGRPEAVKTPSHFTHHAETPRGGCHSRPSSVTALALRGDGVHTTGGLSLNIIVPAAAVLHGPESRPSPLLPKCLSFTDHSSWIPAIPAPLFQS